MKKVWLIILGVLIFTVTAQGLTINKISPNQMVQGQSHLLTVSGDGFIKCPKLEFENGISVKPVNLGLDGIPGYYFKDSNEFGAAVEVSEGIQLGQQTVKVINPDGEITIAPEKLEVIAAQPKIVSVVPLKVWQGNIDQIILITCQDIIGVTEVQFGEGINIKNITKIPVNTGGYGIKTYKLDLLADIDVNAPIGMRKLTLKSQNGLIAEMENALEVLLVQGPAIITKISPAILYAGDVDKIVTLEIQSGEFPANPKVSFFPSSDNFTAIFPVVSPDKKKCEVKVEVPYQTPEDFYDVIVKDQAETGTKKACYGEKLLNIKKPKIISISPNSAKQGQIIEKVEIITKGAHFNGDATQVIFLAAPEKIMPIEKKVNPNQITFKLEVMNDAPVGKTELIITTPTYFGDTSYEQLYLKDAFEIIKNEEVLPVPAPVIVEVSPSEIKIGQEKKITVKCDNTHFKKYQPPFVQFSGSPLVSVKKAEMLDEETLLITVFVAVPAYQLKQDQKLNLWIKNWLSDVAFEEMKKEGALVIKAEKVTNEPLPLMKRESKKLPKRLPK